MKVVFLLLASVCSATIGAVLLKKGVLTIGEVSFKSSIIGELMKLVFNPIVFGGLILYFVSAILWLTALSRTTLNFAYPFTAITFSLVMLSSRLIFLESIPTLRYFGIVLIILGVLVSSVAKS
jgi:multidrug transporter EmrE-like cation transporter